MKNLDILLLVDVEGNTPLNMYQGLSETLSILVEGIDTELLYLLYRLFAYDRIKIYHGLLLV